MGRPLVVGAAYTAAFVLLYGAMVALFNPGLRLSPWYLPAALTFFLLLVGGARYAVLIPLAGLVRFALWPLPGERLVDPLVLGLVMALVFGGTALALQRVLHIDVARRRLHDIAIVIPLSGTVASLAAAFPTVLIRIARGAFPADQFWPQVLNFWIGDASGIVILTPLLVAVFGRPLHRYLTGSVPDNDQIAEAQPRLLPRALETAAMALTMIMVLFVEFFAQGGARPFHFFFLALLLLVWVTVRYGLLGATVASFAIDTGAVLMMRFSGQTLESVADLQQFIFVITLTGLTLGAFVSAYARSNNRLRALIAAQEQAEEQVRYLAYHDPLTGLGNRAMLQLQLTHAIERARRNDTAIAALYLDLNDFKLVNDSLGHGAGDEMLKQFAARIVAEARSVDLVCRLSGDEFVVLLPDMGLSIHDRMSALAAASNVADRVHTSLREAFVIEGTDCFISASIGISIYPDDAGDADSLLGHADAAMYRAKKLGHGYTRYYSEEADTPLTRFALNAHMYRAVEREEFALAYQPIYDIRSAWRAKDEPFFSIADHIDGAEALLRWNAPDGIVLPGAFLPVLESTGLIERVGVWVIREVCRAAAELEAEFGTLFIGANLSLRQLSSHQSLANLIEAIDSSSYDPKHLVIEITEASAMHDPALTERALQSFARRGVRVAIDDFGTGSSSFTRLHEMPVTTLKIDQTFVRHLPHDEKARSIVGTIIDLARNLRLTLVAEGIEREDQWQFLVERGCRYGQGFLFSRPVPLAGFRTLLAQRGRVTSP